VESPNLGWSTCLVWFLGTLLGVTALLLGGEGASPRYSPKFALPESKICWCPGCCGPTAAGGGGRVLGGEASGWRHEKLGEPAGIPGVHTAGNRGDLTSNGQGVCLCSLESQMLSSMVRAMAA